MKSEHRTTRIVILKLEEEERQWLRNVMQNPLHGLTPDEEDPSDKRMRKKFFTALALSEDSVKYDKLGQPLLLPERNPLLDFLED